MIVLGVSGIGVSFGAKTVLKDISFSVNERDRVGIIGVNGVGKTTLLRVITGECCPDQGTVSLGKGVTVGMLSQMTDLSAFGKMTLQQYMESAFPELLALEEELEQTEAQMTEAAAKGDTTLAASLSGKYDSLSATFSKEGGQVFRGKCKSMLVRLGFEDALGRTISEISGGQHTRLSLARLLAREPDILLLDEPTNHLDIASREWVEAAIEEFEGVLLFVSHDRYFIEKFAERIWLLEDGTIRDFKCGYSKFRSIIEHEAACKPVVTTAPKEKKEKPKGGTKEQEKLIRRLEREIEKQEQLVASYDPKIETAAADYQELTRLLAEKEEAELVLMDLMEQWEIAYE